VEGDAARLTQIIGNLLQNAAKFSAPGGRVTLSLGVEGGAAELAIEDEGAGIEPALLGRLFQPFVQSERTAAQSRGGLGLGLALVKGLAELHGGTVRAQSAGVGKGARFVVRLPLAQARPDAPMLPAPRDQGAHAGDGAAHSPS
jgi:signal transduction histidine kinase